MSVCSDIAEYKWLTGSEAAAYLAEFALSEAPLHTALERLRCQLSPAKAHLLLEQAQLRRRAKAKFTAAGRMFFTRVGLEQATDEWVAHYKATRFSGQRACDPAPGKAVGDVPATTPTIADFCCGIGGDLIALSQHCSVVGVDRNSIVAHFAKTNASQFDAAGSIAVDIQRVEEFEFNEISGWHIDPDRRAMERRATSLSSCQPALDTIEKLLSQVPHAAVKLAPATKVPPDWAHRCELEWISRDGDCRQLVAWHGELARTPGLRRATILTTSAENPAAGKLAQRGSDLGDSPRTIVGRPDQTVSVGNQLGDFVFDFDPAVRAAHLQGALAAELNLSTLADGPSYFTGNMPVADAAVSCFKIEGVLPLRVRAVAQHLRERGVGRLEVKKRGVDVDPEKLRRDFKLRGDNEATLLITPVGGRPTVIVARRL